MMNLEIKGTNTVCKFARSTTQPIKLPPKTVTATINIPDEAFDEWYDSLLPTLITADGEVSAFDLDVGYGVIGTLYNPHTVPMSGSMWIEIIEARFKPDPDAVAAGVLDSMLPMVPNRVKFTINEETHEVDVMFSKEEE